MSTKKRVADFQLTKDEDLGDDKTLFASSRFSSIISLPYKLLYANG